MHGATSAPSWRNSRPTSNGIPAGAEDIPVFGARHGVAAVEEFFRIVSEIAEFSEFVVDEHYTDRDKVFALGHYAMALRKNGRKFAFDWIHIFTFHDGKIVKFREFLDAAPLVDAYRA